MGRKVCYVITAMGYGGAERLLANTSSELINRGYEVLIIYLKPDNDILSSLHPQVQSHYVPMRNILSFKKRLLRVIDKFSPDIIHTHLGHADLLGNIVLRNLEVKKFSTLHNVFYKWNYKDKFIFFAYKLIYNHLAKDLKVFAISRAVRSHAIKTYGLEESRVILIPNAIPKSNIHISKYDARQNLNCDQNLFVILFVGRLRVQKSVITLIDAVHRLSQQGLKYKLYLIGQGEQEEKLKTIVNNYKIEDNVDFVGGSNKVEEYMIAADLFVLPSVFEGLPTVILEAFRSKIPVLASNIDGNNDLVQDHVNGILFEPRSASDLAVKISNIMDSKKIQKDLTDAAHSNFLNNYTIDKYVDAHIKEYE